MNPPSSPELNVQADFERGLAELLREIESRARSQMAYNLATNIPKGILQPPECAQHALDIGTISALTARMRWSIAAARAFAADLVEDVNDHAATAYLLGLPQWQPRPGAPLFTCEAGRLICRDGVPLVSIVRPVNSPTGCASAVEADELARRLPSLLNHCQP